jgi:hypothetical protein
VQELDLSAENGCQIAGPPADLQAVLGQVHHEQDATVWICGHDAAF